jgi:hypothetical protein
MAQSEPHSNCQYCAAIAVFEAWIAEHDPEGEMTLLEQIDAYAEWQAKRC